MRLATMAMTAAVLLIPAATASVAAAGLHQPSATDFSAAKKKKTSKVKKTRAPKVEYMRAVPSK